MMKNTLTLFILITTFFSVSAQNVNIPDANFKNYLVNNTSINRNGDNEIQVSEASNYWGSIYATNLGITDLTGIEAFVNLKGLHCNDNQITSIDVSRNLRLKHLWCFNNQLTDINVTYNTSLLTLICGRNQLTSLTLGNNLSLRTIFCEDNKLISLDISRNIGLKKLSCFKNQLTSLDVSNNLELRDLHCYENNLTSLNFVNNSKLSNVAVNDNHLTNFNIANGNNRVIRYLGMRNNPNLFCVQVDDPAYSIANWRLKDAHTNYGINCNTSVCDVTIPDANFKSYLVNNSLINTNGDTEIQCSEATAFTGVIYCQGKQITDLTGIEAFVNVTKLYCNANQLTSLDLSQNIHLTELFCESNQLTNLNITQNIDLAVVNCEGNQLTTIDFTNNVNLVELNCKRNSLATIDLTQNLALSYLECGFNQLTGLNINSNVDLKYVSCQNNQITTLDISNNSKLKSLECSYNQVASLDLTQNIDLIAVRATNNQLTALNVTNGFNQNMLDFRITNNPNLLCVQVDNPAYSSTNWTFKDSQTSYSANCNSVCTVNIPDVNFKSYLVNNNLINTNGNTEIECSEAVAFTGIINCSNKSIANLTGIEAFTALTRLDCSQNQLTSLDVSVNTNLRYLNCRSNALTTIDVSNNLGLRIFNCSQNQLTTIDVTNNTGLVNLYCNQNQLTSLNVTTNASLKYLNCKLNQLTSLDVSNNLALDIFYCGNNLIGDLDVSNNPNLRYFNSKNGALKNLNVANGQNLSIASFDIRNNPDLTCVQVDDVAHSTSSWTNKDSQTNYSTLCSTVPIVAPMLSKAFKEISMYPNPAKSMLHINSEENTVSKIEILDFSGRVLRGEINIKKGIDISNLKSGIYSVKIFLENDFIIKRLIKE
ncbi:hypothetical protein DS884_18040 [Tenacibaculum sp. E3R01]|uniref:T9SS type A sorting domain-containing protein n=1 Tax=Tenacibaculum sp. E3R01 TaxID=2267227 RepID=UPI000DEB2AE7|nr:T9SS type A sorting domain-containing protein [Tenacibaculum sp. E3R01]RBW54346.1 hypothetical protein DS884_18040 [Tenacibaculum sp. E3R01]